MKDNIIGIVFTIVVGTGCYTLGYSYGMSKTNVECVKTILEVNESKSKVELQQSEILLNTAKTYRTIRPIMELPSD